MTGRRAPGTMKATDLLGEALEPTAEVPKRISETVRDLSTRLQEQAAGFIGGGMPAGSDGRDRRIEARLQRRRERTLLVEPRHGAWGIRVHGNGELLQVHAAREAAYERACARAQAEGRRVILHAEDGDIRRILCYGGSVGEEEKKR